MESFEPRPETKTDELYNDHHHRLQDEINMYKKRLKTAESDRSGNTNQNL